MLTEKEKKIKEGMKIMGMGSLAFYFSWIFWYMMIGFITSILVTLILQVNLNFLKFQILGINFSELRFHSNGLLVLVIHMVFNSLSYFPLSFLH